ncbi:MAG: DoxX family protein [Pyrinomonadaceae bacterium]
MSEFWINWQPRALSVLRIMTGFLFLWHGTQKLFAFPPKSGSGELSALILVAGILEFFGGVMILVGFLTRPTAFILSGLMAVAYFMAHGMNAFLPIVNKGELAVLYCFVFLYLFFAGGGEWSVDNLIRKKE